MRYGPSQATLDEQSRMDALPLLTACAFCEWTFQGTVREGREAARAHRAVEHPEARRKRRPARHLGSFRQAPMTDGDRIEIDEERRKRAFLVGIDISE
jgi:hypothetical protein